MATIQGQLNDQQKQHSALLEQSLDETKQSLRNRQLSIQTRLVQEIVAKSLAHVKQVSDIPRMFRKTNRDVPSKAFTYVDQMLESAAQFAQKYGTHVDSTVVQQLLVEIFSELNQQ